MKVVNKLIASIINGPLKFNASVCRLMGASGRERNRGANNSRSVMGRLRPPLPANVAPTTRRVVIEAGGTRARGSKEADPSLATFHGTQWMPQLCFALRPVHAVTKSPTMLIIPNGLKRWRPTDVVDPPIGLLQDQVLGRVGLPVSRGRTHMCIAQ